jgi:energy-coupling factor transport system ATP-binding protein
MEEALRAAGLDPAVYGQRSPFSLSLGEARMLALALLLAQAPGLAVLDAPTAGLDSFACNRTLRAMERLRRSGTTLVVATHDVGFLHECADRVIGLHCGEVVAEGETGSILSDARILARLGYDGGTSGEIARQPLARWL